MAAAVYGISGAIHEASVGEGEKDEVPVQELMKSAVPPPIIPPSETFDVDEFAAIEDDDIDAVRKLFEASFPLRYGDYFYDSLRKGVYAGRPILTCIARRDGKVIGAACATREDEGKGESNVVARGSRTYLMTLAVDPAERRKGVASVLLSRVSTWASRDPSCTALYLHVIEYNKSAMEFYTNLGLIKFGRVAEFYPIDGQNHDAFVYVMYMNGGQPPPPEPPGLMEAVLDWLSSAFNKVVVFAFGDDSSPCEEEVTEASEENLV